jgi:RNA polymerase sigma-70 factor (ECF subfamily)
MRYNLNKNWAKISKGDVKSFEQLYHKYHKRMCLYAVSMLSNINDAEEIVQDIFINLWKNKNSIQITGSLKAYLFRSVHNESINSIKKRLTKKNAVNNIIPEEQWNGLENILNYNAYILEKIEAGETEKKINEAINLLPDQCKAVFKLSRFNNLSNEEIAKKLNLSKNTVRGQIQKAIKKILLHI